MLTKWTVLAKFFLLLILVASQALSQENLPSLIRMIQPSVVTVTVYDSGGDPISQGSGFFVSREGDLITNHHVVKDASRIEVRTSDGKFYSVKNVVAIQKAGDLVRLSVSIPRSAVKPIVVSRRLPEVGQRVIVIGSPLGFYQTVSDGIVSAVRDVSGFGKIIQITAPISSGSSGSPVVNMRGEVIGVATFALIEGQNINFAIPGERVARLLPTQNVAGTREAPKRLMPGVYEIIYDTLVYSEPSEDSFRVFNLSPGMKINVVKIEGDWLQIRSKRGRPDGFIKVSAIQPLLDQKDFYKDKTVRFVVGFSRRGGYDTITRMVARHIGKHIPGNPEIMVENMRGAGSLLAANFMYANARPDGLTIGSWIGRLVLIQRLGLKAIKFDARKFLWVGSPMRETSVCAFTKASGITSIDDWYARTDDPVKIGSTGPGSSTNSIPSILREALQLPIELIQGFAGTARIRKAAELGEIDGGCWAWESVKSTWRNGISSGEVKVVLQAAPKKHPELPHVQNAIELAKTHEARQLIKIGIHYQDAINRAFSLPPGTPRQRVSILRKAFMDTMRDREFLLDASKLRIPVQPVFGNEVEEIAVELFRLNPSMVAKMKEITGF